MRSPTSQTPLAEVVRLAGGIILGKERQIRLSLACLLARGHLLIEDLPGVGKTTLAHLLARLLGLQFQRIQFTSDLLPADIIGVSVFDRASGGFTFHPGPIFAQLILADEVNRATPKTQSALLEAMEERQITTGTQTHPLPPPFFVVATQNPIEMEGTYPLPEAQLDRFFFKLLIAPSGLRDLVEILPSEHLLEHGHLVSKRKDSPPRTASAPRARSCLWERPCISDLTHLSSWRPWRFKVLP